MLFKQKTKTKKPHKAGFSDFFDFFKNHLFPDFGTQKIKTDLFNPKNKTKQKTKGCLWNPKTY